MILVLEALVVLPYSLLRFFGLFDDEKKVAILVCLSMTCGVCLLLLVLLGTSTINITFAVSFPCLAQLSDDTALISLMFGKENAAICFEC